MKWVHSGQVFWKADPLEIQYKINQSTDSTGGLIIIIVSEFRLGKWSWTELNIMKTCLFKYTENFTTKNENFQIKKNLILFFIFLLKT